MVRSRPATGDAASYHGRATEAEVLATLKAYAERFGGFTRHVRRAEGQDLVGLTDCLLWVPAHPMPGSGQDPGGSPPYLFAPIEIKIGQDPVSDAQWTVHRANERIDRIVPAILREGAAPRAGEWSLTEVLARLEEARTWR